VLGRLYSSFFFPVYVSKSYRGPRLRILHPKKRLRYAPSLKVTPQLVMDTYSGRGLKTAFRSTRDRVLTFRK
jgi:hypothetical protein